MSKKWKPVHREGRMEQMTDTSRYTHRGIPVALRATESIGGF